MLAPLQVASQLTAAAHHTQTFEVKALPGCGVLFTVIGMKKPKAAQEEFAAQQNEQMKEAAKQQKLNPEGYETLNQELEAVVETQEATTAAQ